MSLESYLRSCEARYNDGLALISEKSSGIGYHTTLPPGTLVHPTRSGLDYALALFQSGQAHYQERAIRVVKRIISLQDTDPVSATYGIWSWYYEEPLSKMSPPDWNWADFCGARLAQILIDYVELLPVDVLADVQASLEHAAWSIFRRNVGPGYTNIALLGAVVTLAAGEILSDTSLRAYGRRRLERFMEHTAYHGGFNEYNSPTYTMVALIECERLLHLVHEPAARTLAETLHGEIWQMIADHYHPATAQWAGPCSRAYHDWLNAETVHQLSMRLGEHIPLHPAYTPFGGVELGRPLPCPPVLRPRFQALPEDTLEIRCRFVRRSPDELSTWGTTWFTQDACLGSINRDSFWTQCRSLLGYWKTADAPPVALRLRFLHDGKDFSSACSYNAQDGQRVLSAVTLLTDKGDYHPSLDRPPGGIFTAQDFRLRYELIGSDTTVNILAQDRFELASGAYRAVLDTAPGTFGIHEVQWQIGQEEDRVYLDAVCYHGLAVQFNPAQMGTVSLFLGMQVLSMSQVPETTPLVVDALSEKVQEITWSVGKGLKLQVPLQAEKFNL